MKRSNKLTIIILFLTIVLGTFLRFYKLGSVPRGLYLDESAIGYNAYSILKTGKDEFGKSFPVMFRSFTTFQSPIYTYLVVSLIPLVGLTPFSTRFPSALFGVLTLPVFYLLIKKLTSEEYGKKLSLISTIFLSISPWHILYSRTAYESNIALFFLLLGSLLFLYSLKKRWLLLISSISFAISFSAYRAEIIIVPVLVLLLFLTYFHTIKDKIRSFSTPILVSLILGLILIIPTIMIIRTPGFNARTSALNIFSHSLQMPWGYQEEKQIFNRIINSPQILSTKEFLSLYVSYFSPRYIFSLGDSGPRSSYPDFGTFYVWQLPFYLMGLYLLIKEKNAKNLKIFIFSLLLVSPISASLTRDPYMTIRSLPMVIPLIVLISIGLIKFLDMTWPIVNRFKYLILFFVILFSTTRLYLSIFYFNDHFRSSYWDYGWQQVVNSFDDLDSKLPIIVDNSRGEPYIHLLFFLKYDPSKYQQDNFEVPLSEYYTNMNRNLTKNIGRITVKKIEWGKDTDEIEQYIVTDNLAISNQQIIDHGMTLLNEFGVIDGGISFRLIKTNPKSK